MTKEKLLAKLRKIVLDLEKSRDPELAEAHAWLNRIGHHLNDGTLREVSETYARGAGTSPIVAAIAAELRRAGCKL